MVVRVVDLFKGEKAQWLMVHYLKILQGNKAT